MEAGRGRPVVSAILYSMACLKFNLIRARRGIKTREKEREIEKMKVVAFQTIPLNNIWFSSSDGTFFPLPSLSFG